MTCVARIVCWADGRPSEHDGKYLYHWNTNDGGLISPIATVPDPTAAHQFADPVEALNAWNEQSTRRPLRDDGKPNRPLTAFTIAVLSLDVALRDEAEKN